MENRSNELYHYGRKGMKWGQHIFGKQKSVSSARKSKSGSSLGSKVAEWKKKRVAKDKEKEAVKKTEVLKKKSVSDMTDEELNRAINRARMEDTYRSLRPEQVSAGKKFIETTFNKVIAPAAAEAGGRFLKNKLNGLVDEYFKDANPNSIANLTKTRDRLKLQKEIEDYRNPSKKQTSWDDMLKAQQFEKNRKNESVDDIKRANEYMREKKKFDEYMSEFTNNSSKTSYDTAKSTADDIIDGERREVTPASPKVNTAINIGQHFVAGLLEDKSR